MAQWVSDTVETYEDAVQVVLQITATRVDPRKVLWCNYPAYNFQHSELEEKARKDTKQLEKHYKDNLWFSGLWYVGIPQFKLIRRDIASINCEIDLYYVAYRIFEDHSFYWFGKLMPKADKFDVPLHLINPLISALKRGEMETDDARIIERVPGCSTYEFCRKEWKVPDAFLGFIWALSEKNKGFEGLLDHGSCSVMDIFIKELPSPEAPRLPQGNEAETIVSCLKDQMGYPKSKAEEAAKYVLERFSRETVENKIKEALKFLSGI